MMGEHHTWSVLPELAGSGCCLSCGSLLGEGYSVADFIRPWRALGEHLNVKAAQACILETSRATSSVVTALALGRVFHVFILTLLCDIMFTSCIC